MMENSFMAPSNQQDLVSKLEAGQVKLQSRLEEEEEAKAALMGRIQRLTKLIVVSTKNFISPNTISGKPGVLRRHSFGEDDLAYLSDRKRYYFLDHDVASHDSYEISIGGGKLDDESGRFDKRIRKRGMLSWLKIKKGEQGETDSSNSNSPSLRQKQHSFDLPIFYIAQRIFGSAIKTYVWSDPLRGWSN